MKKITKRALSMTVTGLLLMNTFTATVFADNNHEEHENNGHGYGHEYNKDWFENGHDNRDHAKQNGGQTEQEQPEEEIVIELPEEEQAEQTAEDEQQVEEILNEEEITEETADGEEISGEEASEENIETEEEAAVEEEAEETEQPAEEEIVEEAVEEAAEEELEEDPAEETVSAIEEIAENIQEALESSWDSYTLYNYISINEGKSYISLNTQEDGIIAPKSAAAFHKENGNRRYDLSASEYEIEDYDLTELVITSNGIRFVEQSVAAKGQAYFIARLDRVEAVAAANFRASNCVEGIESFTSISNSTITFHRNWYVTLITPMEANQKLLTGIQMPNGKYFGIDYTDTFKAIDSRMIPFSTKLSKDQYEIEDYDFSGLTLKYEGSTYEYRPDGPVAGDGNGFHYYTVKFQKLDKLNKSTYGGGYLIEGWPAWPLLNANATDPDGFPYAAGYYHRDYTVTLHVGDAPAVEEIAPVEEEIVEEVAPVEEPAAEEIQVEEPVVEEQPAQIEEPVEEIVNIAPVVAEIAQAEEIQAEEPAAEEQPAPAEEIPGTVEETEAVEEEPAAEEIAETEEETEAAEEIAEPAEVPAIEEETVFAVEEIKARPRTRKHTAADPVEPIVNEATTNQTETIEEEISESIEDEGTPMAAVEIAAAEAEEILEEEMPLAAAPSEAVSAAKIEAAAAEEVAAAGIEAPAFIEVASMQVADFIEMEDAEIPMAAAGNWSLATMIFGAMSLLLAVFTVASKNISRGLKAAAAIALAATAAIILITSDLSGMMVTANKGTLAVVILNIFEAVFASTASNEARLG